MMAHKSSTPKFKGPGSVLRYAREIQKNFKLTWQAALVKAKAETQLGGAGEGAP
jgi:hypothetical protein